MSVSLEEHGWKGCHVPLSLECLNKHLPTWKNLQVLRSPETYGKRILQFPYEPLHSNILPAYQIGEQIDEGTYGKILKTQRALYTIEDPAHPTRVRRIEEFSEIVMKVNDIEYQEDEEEYAEEVQSVLHEASLHALAYHTLASQGYPNAIPRLFEVYAISSHKTIVRASDIASVYIGMEFISGETLHTYFNDYFKPTKVAAEIVANDRLLMDVLIQLCIYLEILQSGLRFNHRDLKINNVLRRKHVGTWSKAIKHPALSQPWIALHDLVVIDFGFSCVACDESPKSLVQAGSWFRPSHDCLKSGRDIALFLHCLQAYYALETRISPHFLHSLQSSTTAQIKYQSSISLLKYSLDRAGQPVDGSVVFGDGIYKLLRREDVDVPGCAPRTMLEMLESLRLRDTAMDGL